MRQSSCYADMHATTCLLHFKHYCVSMNELELRHELHGVERSLHCLTN